MGGTWGNFEMKDGENSLPVISGEGESSKMVQIEMKNDEECSEVKTDWKTFLSENLVLSRPQHAPCQQSSAFVEEVIFFKLFTFYQYLLKYLGCFEIH